MLQSVLEHFKSGWIFTKKGHQHFFFTHVKREREILLCPFDNIKKLFKIKKFHHEIKAWNSALPFSFFNKTACSPNQRLRYFSSLESHKLAFNFATASLSQQATTLTSLANQVLNGEKYPPPPHTQRGSSHVKCMSVNQLEDPALRHRAVASRPMRRHSRKLIVPYVRPKLMSTSGKK